MSRTSNVTISSHPEENLRRTAQVRSSADLGRALAEARMSRGETQAELAERTGISRAYLAQVERGRTTRLIDIYLRAIRRAGGNITVTFDAPKRDSDAQA